MRASSALSRIDESSIRVIGEDDTSLLDLPARTRANLLRRTPQGMFATSAKEEKVQGAVSKLNELKYQYDANKTFGDRVGANGTPLDGALPQLGSIEEEDDNGRSWSPMSLASGAPNSRGSSPVNNAGGRGLASQLPPSSSPAVSGLVAGKKQSIGAASRKASAASTRSSKLATNDKRSRPGTAEGTLRPDYVVPRKIKPLFPNVTGKRRSASATLVRKATDDPDAETWAPSKVDVNRLHMTVEEEVPRIDDRTGFGVNETSSMIADRRDLAAERNRSIDWLSFWGSVNRLQEVAKLLVDDLEHQGVDSHRLRQELQDLQRRLGNAMKDVEDLSTTLENEREHAKKVLATERERFSSVADENERLMNKIAAGRREVTLAETAMSKMRQDTDESIHAAAKFKHENEQLRMSHALEIVKLRHDVSDRNNLTEEQEIKLAFLQDETRRKDDRLDTLSKTVEVLTQENKTLQERIETLSATADMRSAVSRPSFDGGFNAAKISQMTNQKYQKRENELQTDLIKERQKSQELSFFARSVKRFARTRCESFEKAVMDLHDIDANSGVRYEAPRRESVVVRSPTDSGDGRRGTKRGSKVVKYACHAFHFPQLDPEEHKIADQFAHKIENSRFESPMGAFGSLLWGTLGEMVKAVEGVTNAMWAPLDSLIPPHERNSPNGKKELIHATVQAIIGDVHRAMKRTIDGHQDALTEWLQTEADMGKQSSAKLADHQKFEARRMTVLETKQTELQVHIVTLEGRLSLLNDERVSLISNIEKTCESIRNAVDRCDLVSYEGVAEAILPPTAVVAMDDVSIIQNGLFPAFGMLDRFSRAVQLQLTHQAETITATGGLTAADAERLAAQTHEIAALKERMEDCLRNNEELQKVTEELAEQLANAGRSSPRPSPRYTPRRSSSVVSSAGNGSIPISPREAGAENEEPVEEDAAKLRADKQQLEVELAAVRAELNAARALRRASSIASGRSPSSSRRPSANSTPRGDVFAASAAAAGRRISATPIDSTVGSPGLLSPNRRSMLDDTVGSLNQGGFESARSTQSTFSLFAGTGSSAHLAAPGSLVDHPTPASTAPTTPGYQSNSGGVSRVQSLGHSTQQFQQQGRQEPQRNEVEAQLPSSVVRVSSGVELKKLSISSDTGSKNSGPAQPAANTPSSAANGSFSDNSHWPASPKDRAKATNFASGDTFASSVRSVVSEHRGSEVLSEVGSHSQHRAFVDGDPNMERSARSPSSATLHSRSHSPRGGPVVQQDSVRQRSPRLKSLSTTPEVPRNVVISASGLSNEKRQPSYMPKPALRSDVHWESAAKGPGTRPNRESSVKQPVLQENHQHHRPRTSKTRSSTSSVEMERSVTPQDQQRLSGWDTRPDSPNDESGLPLPPMAAEETVAFGQEPPQQQHSHSSFTQKSILTSGSFFQSESEHPYDSPLAANAADHGTYSRSGSIRPSRNVSPRSKKVSIVEQRQPAGQEQPFQQQPHQQAFPSEHPNVRPISPSATSLTPLNSPGRRRSSEDPLLSPGVAAMVKEARRLSLEGDPDADGPIMQARGLVSPTRLTSPKVPERQLGPQTEAQQRQKPNPLWKMDSGSETGSDLIAMHANRSKSTPDISMGQHAAAPRQIAVPTKSQSPTRASPTRGEEQMRRLEDLAKQRRATSGVASSSERLMAASSSKPPLRRGSDPSDAGGVAGKTLGGSSFGFSVSTVLSGSANSGSGSVSNNRAIASAHRQRAASGAQRSSSSSGGKVQMPKRAASATATRK